MDPMGGGKKKHIPHDVAQLKNHKHDHCNMGTQSFPDLSAPDSNSVRPGSAQLPFTLSHGHAILANE